MIKRIIIKKNRDKKTWKWELTTDREQLVSNNRFASPQDAMESCMSYLDNLKPEPQKE